MTRKLKLRQALLIILSAVFLVSLCVICLFATNFVEAEGTVLPENTAQYTFENDATYPWTWDRATNTWSRHFSGQTVEMSQRPSKLTLKVTSAGNVVFQYLYHNKNESDYLHISKNGTPLEQQYRSPDYEQVTISVAESDTLTFEFPLSTYTSGYDYYVSIQGLDNSSFVNTTFNVTATAEGGGTVAIEDGEFSASANKDVLFGTDTVLKAQANDGQVFYGWKLNDEYVSTQKELTVSNVVAEQTYTAVFVAPDYQRESELSGWTKDGTAYRIPSFARGDTDTFSIEFVDEKYLTFDISINYPQTLLTFEVTIDGKTAYNLTSQKNDDSTTNKQYSPVLHAVGNGRHVAVFSLKISTLTIPTAPSFSLDNLQIKTSDSLEMQDISVQWNEHFGEVWVLEGYGVTTEYTITTNGYQLTEKQIRVPKGMTVSFYAIPKTEIDSTVILGKTTHVVLSGYYDTDTQIGMAQGLALTVGDEHFASGKTLEIRFLEYVPAPKISYTKTVGGFTQEQDVLIESGGTVDILKDSSNTVLFQVNKYNITDTETLTAQAGSNSAQVDSDSAEEYFGVVLTNVTDRAVLEIQLNYGDTYFCDKITIQLNITTTKGVQDVVFEGASITVENHPDRPWFYDDKMSSDEAVAYTSGSSYGTAPVGGFASGSYLAFKVNGTGSFTFEFYLDGGNYKNAVGSSHTSWAGYSLNKKPESTYGDQWCVGSTSSGFESQSGYGAQGITNLAYGNNPDGDGKTHVDAVIYSNTGDAIVKRITDGENWFSCTIPISGDGETTIYLVHGLTNSNSSTYYSVTQMSVRNVKFFSGSKQLSWEVQNGAKAVAAGNGTITAAVGGESKTSGEAIPAGTRVHFEANVTGNKQFYFWKDSDGKILSYDLSFDYPLADKDAKVIAVIDDKDKFEARIEGNLYPTVTAALSAANDGDKVILLKSSEISGEGVTIGKGVSLILPINGKGDYYEMGTASNATNQISWSEGSRYATPVITLTISGNVTINGSLFVGGVLHYPDQSAQGHTSGAYTQLILNGNVTVAAGGVMDVYGLVTGTGGIEVLSGGVLYQPFLILDFAGGTNTEGLFNHNQTPFKRYAMINIQCANGYKINYGAELWGHASLFFLSSITTLDTQFISYQGTVRVNGSDKQGTTTLINLAKGAWAQGVYKAHNCPSATGVGNTENIGQTTLTINGGASAGYMDFLGLVQTNNVAFSIPYNYNLVLQNGEYTMDYSYKLMPGATFKVDAGATLNINKAFYVYDGLIQTKMSGKAYPSAQQLTDAGYTTNANFIVNGTLKINSNATFLGVVQSTAADATIEIAADAVLTGKIVDGGQTSYDCNYAEYDSSARVWDASSHGKESVGTIAQLQAGHTYKSLTTKSNWTLTGVNTKYEPSDFGNAGAMASHSHVLSTGKLNDVTTMTGSWKVVHEDTLDWSAQPQDGDGTPGGSTVAHATRYCSELGCGYSETKDIFDIPESIGSLVYKGANFTAEELVGLFEKYFSGIENATVSASVDSVQNVGTYTVTITLENGYFLDNGVYTDTHRFNWSVTAKPITVTLEEQTSVYDGNTVTNDKLDQNAFDAPGLCDGDHLDLTIQFASGQQPRDVGTYNLEIVNYQGGNKNTNYTITPVVGTGTYEITARPITVELRSITRDYNGEVPQASKIQANLASGSTLGTGDELSTLITISITDAAKDVGTYTVTATATAAANNYKIKVTDGSYQIDKKAVTVTADNLSSVYGEQPQALTFKVDGVVDGEEAEFRTYIAISCEQELSAQTEVGEYTITVQLADAEPQNYKVSFVNGKYNVTNAAFKDLVFNNDTVIYDGETHEIKVTGAPDGAVITYTVQDQAFSGARDVGSYKITATISHDNYKQETRTATLTINQRAITVNLPSTSRVYNGTVPQATELAATLAEGSTLGTGDNLNDLVALSIVGASKNVGTYAVKGAATQPDGNYTIQFSADGQYEITKLQLTVKIKPQTKVYDGLAGTLQQGLWEKTDGEWVGSERPEITLELEQKSNNVRVDSYNIKGVCADGNYDITFTDGTGAYTITKRPLTVTAHNLSSVYGDAIADLKGAYDVDGWIEQSALLVTLQCNVTSASAVVTGGYAIVVHIDTPQSELSNYELQTVDGTYTVSPRQITVKLPDFTRVYNGNEISLADLGAATVTVGRLVNNDVLADLITFGFASTGANAGSYVITGSASEQSGNYTITVVDGTYSVTKLDLTNSASANFGISGAETLENGKLNAQLTGEELVLQGFVVLDGVAEPLATKPIAAITAPGEYTVTVEIDEVNYSGSRTFTVVVTDENGMTEELVQLLAQLKSLTEGKSVQDLTVDDFDQLKQIKGLLQQIEPLLQDLSSESLANVMDEIEVGYTLTDGWNAIANGDDRTVQTAVTIADAALGGLFVTLGTLQALAAVAFATRKGGLL